MNPMADNLMDLMKRITVIKQKLEKSSKINMCENPIEYYAETLLDVRKDPLAFPT